MVVLDQFYEIVEAKTTAVSPFWKFAHIITFIGSAICGFATAFTIGQIEDMFNYNCILGAEIVFDNETFINYTYRSDSTVKQVPALDLIKTTWGMQSKCNFVQFTPLFITISAVVWGTYFTILTRGGGGLPTDLLSRPWAIVYPCLLFTVVSAITYLVSTIQMSSGIDKFCNQFSSVFNTTESECTNDIGVYLSQFHPSDDHIYRLGFSFRFHIRAAVISSDVGLWTWFLQLAIVVSRVFCVADFELRLITVEAKEEETVEKVVEFELQKEDEMAISQV